MFVLKMKYVVSIIHLQGHSVYFYYITANLKATRKVTANFFAFTFKRESVDMSEFFRFVEW